jgi:tetrahydromethanopterin S-methyltransferase subunit E
VREVKNMVSVGEAKSTIATAIAAAFGFIIALIWKEIIVGLFAWAGLKVNEISDTTGAIIAIVSGIIITLVCIFGILYVSKWGGVKK